MKPLIQYQIPQYQPLSGMVPPITVQEFRGISTFDPFSIPENYFTDMSNFVTDDFPAMTTRPGYTVLGSAIGTKVLGLGVYKDTELHAVFGDGTWRKWDGSSWVTLKSGLSTTAEWSFTSFEGNLGDVNLIGANGVNGLHRYDGTTVQTFGDAPADINYIVTYSNRLWGASGIELLASALDQPNLWNKFDQLEDDSYGKTMESIRGENINALSGSLTKLTIGMPGSIHELYGSLPSDFNTRLITDDEGINNHKSQITQEGIMRFIHDIGLFEYGGGILPDKSFSDIVRTYFGDITINSVAGSDGTKLYFCLSGDTIMVYDPRPGVQAWSVWNDIYPTQFVRFQNDLYIGDSQGRVLRLGGATDNGNPITARLVTKPLTAESVAQKVKWIKMFTYWELGAGTTLKISFSPTQDGNDWTEIADYTGGGGNNIERLIVPVRQFQLKNMVRIKFDVVGWARLHQYTRQIRIMPLV